MAVAPRIPKKKASMVPQKPTRNPRSATDYGRLTCCAELQANTKLQGGDKTSLSHTRLHARRPQVQEEAEASVTAGQCRKPPPETPLPSLGFGGGQALVKSSRIRSLP